MKGKKICITTDCTCDLPQSFIKKHNIPTVQTYGTLEEAQKAMEQNELVFPVFVKPRTGSGSVYGKGQGHGRKLAEAGRCR